MSASDAMPAGSVPAPRSASGAGTASTKEDAHTECLHCGLPVPAPRRKRGDRFCCGGCAHVYELIRDSGLARYYDLRTRPTGPPADLRPDSLAWLDHLLQEAPADGVRSLELDVQGIHCAACVWLLQEVYRRTDGAVDLCINPAVGRAELLWQADSDAARQFVREAERYGYRFGPAHKRVAGASRGLQIRLAICAAAAMNAMIFGICFYLGLAPSDGILFDLFGILNLVLGTIAAVVGGDVFLRGAWRAARAGIVHLDLPIATGIVLAWGGSVWGHFTAGPQSGYFDSLAVFVTLMLLGRFLQERHLERNAAALLSTDGLGGLSTRVRRADGRIDSRPATEVSAGDELWIVPGDLVPVRAAALDGPVTVSLDWIDGESRPRSFASGETLPAGSFNAGDGVLRARAEEGFEDSRLHDLLRPGRGNDVLAGNTWGRVARIYVFAVFTLAAAGFLAWIHAGPARALAVTVSILVVTCPCAIGIAMPLAHDLVHHALRRHGVFVRRTGFLDRALRVRHIIFDKTGTLTRGRLALTDEAERTLAAMPAGERNVLHDLVTRSNHPVSRAIAAALRELDPSMTATPDLAAREVPGQGLAA
ncbi:heavy metal translocating P-type ATPase metal-binding domain-containing protein, partial [bacterium]|nr:heavy metal translocating P-type ATPase metal-binding domain-containing protein [bacterium]